MEWWQNGPPEMYLPPDIRHETKEVVIVRQIAYGQADNRSIDITYLGKLTVDTWTGDDAPRHQFRYLVTDQPSLACECRDGVEDTWNYVNLATYESKRFLGIPFDQVTAVHTHRCYELKSGCQRYDQLPADERAARTPTVERRLNKACSQCPYVE